MKFFLSIRIFLVSIVHIVQRLAQHGGHQLVALGINPLIKVVSFPDSFSIFVSPQRGNAEGCSSLGDGNRNQGDSC
jgi:hypothetical protein